MCIDCGEQIAGTYYTLEDNGVVCAKDFKVNIELKLGNNKSDNVIEASRKL